MPDTNERNALLPHHYQGDYRPPLDWKAREIRLFGANWAFGAMGDFEPLAVAGQRSFHATHLYATPPPSFHSPGARPVWHYLRQNVFALNIYRGLGENERYPVQEPKQPLPADTRLIVQKIETGAGTPAEARDRLYQLLHGRIEVPGRHQGRGREKLLKVVREQLGLLSPTAQEQSSIFLYPDGFCIHGGIKLPWIASPLDGWFKLSTRGASVAGAPAGDPEGGLVLCLDPALPGNDDNLIAAWTQAIHRLREMLTIGAGSEAHWLNLAPRGEISPEHFFWPADYVPKKDYFHRPAEGRLRIEAAFMAARVTPGRTLEQHIAGMEISGKWFEIARTGDGRLLMTSGIRPPSHDLLYRFSSGVEKLEFGSGGDRELVLAVPLIDTARMIREESGMPERGTVSEKDPVGPVWTFTPLENGLLHWPFPDATLEGMQTLVEREKGSEARAADSVDEEAAPNSAEGLVSGAMLLGNDEALPGFEPSHRLWQLAITDGRNGSFELELERTGGGAEEKWRLLSATVAIGECTFAFEGVLPIIPFQQTRERLLPDHEERALRTRGLRAVSPALLRGIEAEMWSLATSPANRKVQARLAIRDFRIAAPTKAEPAKLGGRVGLHCTVASRLEPEADPELRPWLWTRFGDLPTVQTMPLAVSGAAALRPSGTRELQPFQRTRPDATIFYSFENALDMARPSPRLVTNSKFGGDWSYQSPAGREWAGEIGMSVLTLPSVTIFPHDQGDPDPARLPEPKGSNQKWLWPLGNGEPLSGGAPGAVPFKIELRHDLAWRDEFYAQANVGALPSPDERSSGAFEPQSSNGPQDGRGNTSCRAAWDAADRLATLAATDGREMVLVAPKNPAKPGQDLVYSLANFSGSERHVATSLRFSRHTLIEGEGWQDPGKPLSDAHRVVEAGRVEIAGGAELDVLLKGLPDGGDLTGFSGRLAGSSYHFGTLENERAKESSDFADQRKLQSGRFAGAGPFVRRSVGGVDIYTLPTPLVIARDEQKIELWLVDVPLKSTAPSPQDWLDREHNHLQGFRWAVQEIADGSRGLIHWKGGIYFEPLILSSFKETQITITGRLGVMVERRDQSGLKSGEAFLPQILKGVLGEKPILIISSKEGKWSWDITRSADAFLPLEEAGEGGDPPAILQLLPGATAKLHFDLFGEPAEVELTKTEDQGGSIIYERDIAPSATTPLCLTQARVALSKGSQAISLGWSYNIAATIGVGMKLSVTGKLGHPRYGLSANQPAAVLLTGNGGKASWEIGSDAIEQQFGDGLLALTWSDGNLAPPGGSAERSWIHLFKSRGCAGGVMALLRRKTGAANFDYFDAKVDFEAELTGAGKPLPPGAPPMRLRGSAARGSGSLALDGSLLLSGQTAGLIREAEIRFDGAPVRTMGPKATVAGHVRHVLEKASADSTARVQFAAVQRVTFGDAPSGRGQIDFDVALIAQRNPHSDAILATIPGKYDTGAGSFGTGAPALCYRLPPMSAAVREFGQARLREALSGSPSGTDGWADLLLRTLEKQGGPEANGSDRDSLADPVPADGLDLLIELGEASGGPLVHSLAEPRSWQVPGKSPDYEQYLKLLADQLSRLVMAVPPSFMSRRTRRGYALDGPDIHKERVVRLAREISVAVPDRDPEDASASVGDWERRLLASLAPWAAAGLLATFSGKTGSMQVRLVRPRSAFRGEIRAAGDAWFAKATAAADPRRIALPGEPDAIAFAYAPAATGAVDLSYRVAGLDEEADEPILSANGLQRVWQLERIPKADGRHYRDDGDFWLAERQNVAFRPSLSWTKQKQRLTARLWEPAAAAAAEGLLPSTAVRGAEPPQLDAFRQFFAPPQLIVRDVSPRPGVWHMRRLGLAGGKAQGSALVAPELPFHARTPRPPVTGRHDRTRTSEFEAASFMISAHPEFVLYGRRADPPQKPGPAPALSRAPLAESAWCGTVSRPGGGLIGPDWDGLIGFHLQLRSPLAGEGHWKLEAARAMLNGQIFPLEIVSDGAPSEDPRGDPPFLIRGRPKTNAGEAVEPNFADHVLNLRLSTRVLIECELLLEGAAQLSRLVAFELLVAPAGAGLERPFYLRFEDPAYNDRLTLPAKFAAGLENSLFCADRDDVRTDDTLVVAWRSADPTIPRPDKLELKIVRKPVQADGEPEVIDLEPWGMTEGHEVWANIGCSRLTKRNREDGIGFAPLKVGDRLLVSVPSAPGREAASLEFEVTGEPLFPGNPAAFALLKLDRSAAPGAISAPLYAQSPTPALVELLDPRDLFNGVARFRASYRWIHFAARAKDDPALYAVQKIAGDGGTWLPSRLSEWKAAPGV